MASDLLRKASRMSLSSMMMIRVLPGDGITAPRLPRLKSYSLCIDLRFTWNGFASGDKPRPLFARGMDDYQNPAQGIHSQGDKPGLAFGIRVLDSDTLRVAQCLL